jgi:hypothetical protein
VLTYLLYRHLKNKGQTQRKIGLAIFISTTVLMTIYSIKFFMNGAGFGHKYETVEIKQDIGGKLICNSVLLDIRAWCYNVDYMYINVKGDTLDFKYGVYKLREWKKDEQIKKYNDWLILKTGYSYRSDRLIIKNILSDTTKIFDIDNQFIEKDSLWKVQNIKSLLNYCCAETFVENINENKISLKYKFRTDENLPNKYDERRITYKIDAKTGDIKMTEIK